MVASLIFGLYTTIENEVSQRRERKKQIEKAKQQEVRRARASISTATTGTTIRSKQTIVYPLYDAAISARPLPRKVARSLAYTPSIKSEPFMDDEPALPLPQVDIWTTKPRTMKETYYPA